MFRVAPLTRSRRLGGGASETTIPRLRHGQGLFACAEHARICFPWFGVRAVGRSSASI